MKKLVLVVVAGLALTLSVTSCNETKKADKTVDTTAMDTTAMDTTMTQDTVAQPTDTAAVK
ncbi:MAG: entericidin [Prevotellaceae bacterium]|nr:entericidin [Prevotella sp.]MDD7530057.1 entericidin [Prevotellaceae bacterium]MDY2633832.1 entericidin [Prevotella sp.]